MTDEKLYAIWNTTPHSIDRLRMIAEFGRTLYRMGQEEMRERAAALIEQHQESDSNTQGKHLTTRIEDNLAGVVYAVGIRALEVEP